MRIANEERVCLMHTSLLDSEIKAIVNIAENSTRSITHYGYLIDNLRTPIRKDFLMGGPYGRFTSNKALEKVLWSLYKKGLIIPCKAGSKEAFCLSDVGVDTFIEIKQRNLGGPYEEVNMSPAGLM